jgi:preprotein translocase subunit SecA
VEQSEEISRLLDRHGVSHRLLNAVNNAEEAQVVKSAGTFGAVTVATNMAGRGTDIVLGPGLDRQIARKYASLLSDLLQEGAGQVVLSCATAYEADALVTALSAIDGVSNATEERSGRTEVRVRLTDGGGGAETVRMEFGLGLHVVGTEMGESGRIDRQLRGRSGRQGETGSSRFLLSMEDHALMNGVDRGSSGSGEKGDDASGSVFLEGMGTERRLREVQDIAEREDEVSRAATWDYNQVVERQTLRFYRGRRDVIDADGFLRACVGFMRGKARRLVDQHLPPAMIGRYAARFERIAEEVWLDYRVDCRPLFGLGPEALKEALAELMAAGLEEAAARYGSPEIEKVAKLLYLRTCDELWGDHLSRLQDLMLGSQLCGMGHKAAVADYLFQSVGMERRFGEEVLDAFLPMLLAFEPRDEPVPQAEAVSVVEDVHQILV